jgi:hypothetical protein
MQTRRIHLPVSIAFLALALSSCWEETGCVARGTQVLTPTGWRPVEDLAVGDIVYAFDEPTSERHEARIVGIRSVQREVGLIAVGDHDLRVTSDHPLYCPKTQEYAPAGDWFVGKRTELAVLRGNRFEAVAAHRVSAFVGRAEVFDITVDHERHNFVADGILVHNKSPGLARCELDGGAVWEYDSCECRDSPYGVVECQGDGGVCRCDDEPCADVDTDWQNCGACGRVCDNQGMDCPVDPDSGELQCCVAGECAPSWGECIIEGTRPQCDGSTVGGACSEDRCASGCDGGRSLLTCDEVCAEVGERCVADGCGEGGFTELRWVPPQGSSWSGCPFSIEIAVGEVSGATGVCDAPLEWQETTVRRCCCTDSQ